MQQTAYNVAIVGATGAVGEVFLDVLAEREFPIDQLFPLASERSEGETVMLGNKSYTVENLANFDFSQVHYAFFSAGSAVSEKYAPIAAQAGCVVIDNTSVFRNQDDIPLVIPEVNSQALEHYRERNIIANPNCSTIQMLVALKPIYDAVGIDRINVATYQAVSGAGRSAIEELARQTAELLNGQEASIGVFAKQIAFNAIPHIDLFEENGYTREEMKMVRETQKILNDPNIRVNPTAVRVPVFYGHSEAIHVETRDYLGAEEARHLLDQAPGVVLVKDEDYPTAISHAASRDGVFVGRLREDISHINGLDMWVVSDNVRKGAALNAVQIAELLISDSLYFH